MLHLQSFCDTVGEPSAISTWFDEHDLLLHRLKYKLMI